MADLFGEHVVAAATNPPLAERLRPRGLEAVVGQAHLTGPEGAIGRMALRGCWPRRWGCGSLVFRRCFRGLPN
jgi:hypothetical protein